MNKLTREQAEWLLAELCYKKESIPNPAPLLRNMITFIEINKIADVINQCTESEPSHEEMLQYSLAEKLIGEGCISRIKQDIRDIQEFLDKTCCPSGYLMGERPWSENEKDC